MLCYQTSSITEKDFVPEVLVQELDSTTVSGAQFQGQE